MSNLIHWYIVILTVVMLGGCVWLLWVTRVSDAEPEGDEPKTMSHEFDGIVEYDNPLPRWWLWMFYLTIIFGVVYFVLYPGLGKFEGTLGWSQEKQHADEVAVAQKKFDALFEQYKDIEVVNLVSKDQALTMGQRLFANNCSTCHGVDGKGSPGFPNLTDSDWLYGDSGEAIEASITNGRNGYMPAHSTILDEAAIDAVAAYVLSLSGGAIDDATAEAGQTAFAVCGGCHGMEGKGNPALGAPDLTDNVWLYGGDLATVKASIKDGRKGVMPAHKDKLSAAKIRVLSAYVYSLRP